LLWNESYPVKNPVFLTWMARKTEKADLAEHLCATYKQENTPANMVALRILFESAGLCKLNSSLKLIFRK